MNTPTPETDAALRPWIDSEMPWVEVVGKIADLARKLERERDEARNQLKQDDVGIAGMKLAISDLRAERDELIKVCDQMYHWIRFKCRPTADYVGQGHNFCMNETDRELGNEILSAYSQLPHVKGQSK